MNILNNLNNNNNNNNNNNDNNNNNNRFESMNVNMRSFGTSFMISDENTLVTTLLRQGVNPWSREMFQSIRYANNTKVPGLKVLQAWMSGIVTTYPSCGFALLCELFNYAASSYAPNICSTGLDCPLYSLE
ncbi:probable serine/threonine-protein kinase DDB_G0286465 [Eurytemora carolleeae]|uniref:probable serine/threonine-protein kinase DDB_G0286465 n=1 Tax=Eurytemora carolleeae TaxID=1294199 RepID=UPI000C76CC39|nr:probable serine/threonine-protein kinase DDB_G0286465 [Eurytemora carolleeae]|eukprot:XP_023338579.1 probable serine/threonine-protein kinase DDB_G0286465 [Eurytemora affinis]